MNIKTLHKIELDYSADSVEWCPLPGSRQYFLCGTYELEKNKENAAANETDEQLEAGEFNVDETPIRRKGRIYLFEYNSVENKLTQLDTVDTAAITDQKWTVLRNDEAIFAASDSIGQVELYKLNGEKLEKISTVAEQEVKDYLALSLDWNPETEANRQIISSDSKGGITLYQLNESNVDAIRKWNAHSYEAWISVFDKWNPNVVYTGGDDMRLRGYDLRAEGNNDAPLETLLNKSHFAGITVVYTLASNENIIATGSYDEYFRAFDKRRFNKPIAEIKLTGGLWRMKSDPFEHKHVACCCMYDNFTILELDKAWSDPKVVAEYYEHKNICYSADWCHQLNQENDSMIMATCSFYDKLLCVSSVSSSVKEHVSDN